MLKKYIINTDGASRGNPGPAAASFIIRGDGGVIWVEEGVFLGENTNNFAEYVAVKLALERLIKDFPHVLPAEVTILADSMLIVNQLSDKFKVKNSVLKDLYSQIKQLEIKAGTVIYRYVPRTENFMADKLANMALDKLYEG